MPTEHYVLTQAPIESLIRWQSSLDREQFPLVLTGIDGSLHSAATVNAMLKEAAVTFIIWRSSLTQIVRPWHDGLIPKTWRHVICFRDTGSDRSAFAVTLAAFAYAHDAQGVFYEPDYDVGVVDDFGKMRAVMRQVLDAQLRSLGL